MALLLNQDDEPKHTPRRPTKRPVLRYNGGAAMVLQSQAISWVEALLRLTASGGIANFGPTGSGNGITDGAAE